MGGKIDRKAFIQAAEKTVPNVYEYMRRRNDVFGYGLPSKKCFPKVNDLQISYLNKEFDTAFNVVLTLEDKVFADSEKNIKQIKLEGSGHQYENEAGELITECFFFEGAPTAVRKFSKVFAEHLIFDVLSEAGVSVEDWYQECIREISKKAKRK